MTEQSASRITAERTEGAEEREENAASSAVKISPAGAVVADRTLEIDLRDYIVREMLIAFGRAPDGVCAPGLGAAPAHPGQPLRPADGTHRRDHRPIHHERRLSVAPVPVGHRSDSARRRGDPDDRPADRRLQPSRRVRFGGDPCQPAPADRSDDRGERCPLPAPSSSHRRAHDLCVTGSTRSHGRHPGDDPSSGNRRRAR